MEERDARSTTAKAVRREIEGRRPTPSRIPKPKENVNSALYNQGRRGCRGNGIRKDDGSVDEGQKEKFKMIQEKKERKRGRASHVNGDDSDAHSSRIQAERNQLERRKMQSKITRNADFISDTDQKIPAKLPAKVGRSVACAPRGTGRRTGGEGLRLGETSSTCVVELLMNTSFAASIATANVQRKLVNGNGQEELEEEEEDLTSWLLEKNSMDFVRRGDKDDRQLLDDLMVGNSSQINETRVTTVKDIKSKENRSKDMQKLQDGSSGALKPNRGREQQSACYADQKGKNFGVLKIVWIRLICILKRWIYSLLNFLYKSKTKQAIGADSKKSLAYDSYSKDASIEHMSSKNQPTALSGKRPKNIFPPRFFAIISGGKSCNSDDDTVSCRKSKNYPDTIANSSMIPPDDQASSVSIDTDCVGRLELKGPKPSKDWLLMVDNIHEKLE